TSDTKKPDTKKPHGKGATAGGSSGAGSGGGSGGGSSGGGSSEGSHKVTICHRTNSNTNPYVVITVDTDAAGGGKDKGAGDHAHKHLGPVWNQGLKAQHTKWGDIIPAYVDDQGVSFPGMNWTATGRASHKNGCRAVTPPTTTTTPPTTTTTPPTTTTTPPNTTTTAPDDETSVLPTKAGPGDRDDEEAENREPDKGVLAFTGSGLPLMAVFLLSLALLTAGALLLGLPKRLKLERIRRH
ncbi:MAG: hypothetical protein ACRDV1_09860, partial [Actinomycetes bacterium]